MKCKVLMTRIGGKLGKTGVKLRKHSPQIMLVVGIVGVVSSTVMACRATTKLSGILDRTKEESEKIHRYSEADNETLSEPYDSEDAKKDLAITYAHAVKDITKLYAPSVLFGVLSLSSIIVSHRILNDRYLAATSACASVMAGFAEYRSNVRERFGSEVDKELRYNIKPRTIEEKVTDEKTGKTKKVKEKIGVAAPGDLSPFSRIFDKTCKYWNDDQEYNINRLRMEEEFANHTLKSKGYIFLNDVYERIGFKPIPEGQLYGWIYEKPGDYVSFGIDELNRETAQDFADGYIKELVLDFNVQGNIMEKL